MGNCLAAQQHVSSIGNSRRSSIPDQRKLSLKGDITDFSSDRETDDSSTLPLSPGSTLVPLSPRSSPYDNLSSPYHSPRSSSYSPEKKTSPLRKNGVRKLSHRSITDEASPTSSSAPPRPQGREVQRRLEKARYMKIALAQTEARLSLEATSFATLSNGSGTFDDDPPSTASSTSSYRYSLSSDASVSRNGVSEKLNHEFEASVSRGMIWAEIEQPDQVLAVALSRTKPTLSQPTPPLFLAVGTQDGTVSIQPLLDDTPLPKTTMFDERDDLLARKLGERLVLERPGRIRALDFSPDGTFFAVAGDDCSCAIYQMVLEKDGDSHVLVDLQCVAEIQRVDRVYAIQFSPDGRYLAVGGYDETVAIVEMAHMSSDVIAEIPTNGLVFALDWSPDSRYLAIGGSDKCCSLVDVDTSWHVFREIRRPSSVHTVKWHPNGGRYLAIGANDVAILKRDSLTVVNEIDLGSKQQQRSDHRRRSSLSMYKINAVCWSPNGSYLVVCGADNLCKLVETKTFTPVHDINRGTCTAVWGQQSVLTGMPRRYLVLGGDEDCKVVILKAGLEVARGASSVGDDLSSSASSSHFSQRSDSSSNGDWVLRDNAFLDVEEAIEVSHNDSNMTCPRKANVTAVTFSRGSKSRPSAYFAYATDDGRVTIRSTGGGKWKVVKELTFPNVIRSLSFSRGGRFLALGGEDSIIYVASYPEWSIVVESALEAPISCVTFSKNNERLAIGCSDGILTLLDPHSDWLATGEIDSSESPVLSMDWTSKNLAIGRLDGTVSVYETEQVLSNFCVPVAELIHKAPVRAVGLGVASRFLAVGGDDGFVNLYSSKGNWVLCHQVPVPANGGIASIEWSPTGRYMAFGGENGLFKVIDTIFWANVDEADASIIDDGSDQCISTIAFSQDGRLVAYGGRGTGTNVLDSSSWETKFSFSLRQQVEDSSDRDESSISSREDCEV